jgi:3-deoxy-D-manno-octulosonic-acid transferase
VLKLYNALLKLLWPVLYLYQPFRGTIKQRLGKFELGRYNPARQSARFLINAVSAGEVVAIAPFIQELRHRLPLAQIALMTTTQSGQTMAKQMLGDAVELLAYFPLVDLPSVVQRYLDKLQPSLYITTEAELWPNIQSQCRERGIPVALVNARLYLHNKRGLRGAIVRRLYELCDLVVCQDERQRGNFLSFGVPAKRLVVSGNTKFDFTQPEWDEAQLDDLRRRLDLGAGPLVVAGSTHPGEEEVMLDILAAIRPAYPQLQLILAPRHIERAAGVLTVARSRGYHAISLSEVEARASSGPAHQYDVLVVDRYGVLVDMYRLADIVVIGGTFHEKVGGHNILEATVLGKPVIVGPHTFSITTQLAMLQAANGVVIVKDPVGLRNALSSLLGDGAKARAIGTSAREATLANRGAAARAVDAVLALHTGADEPRWA